jgi:hypothetical protein
LVNQRKKQPSQPWPSKLLSALLSNPKITLAGVVVLVLAFVALSSKGCGGGEKSPDPKPSKALKSVTAKLIVTTPENASSEPPEPPESPESPQKRIMRPRSNETRDAKPKDAARSKKIGRPADVADWRGDEYASAARDGDPQLAAALGYFGRRFAGKESAANFLAKLLDPSDAAPVAEMDPRPTRGLHGAGNPSHGAKTPKFTEAIIAALVVNGTPRARQILESIADGTLKTADKQTAAILALKALAAHSCPETEDLLFRIITAPEGTAADDPPANKSANLRGAAMEMVRAGASELLSVRLAKWMLATETSKALRDQLWACLKEPRPQNLAAQIMLYRSDRSDLAMRDWLEPWIVTCSSNAIGRLMGIPAHSVESAPARGNAMGGMTMGISTLQRREAALAKIAPATDPHRLAEWLWSANLAAVIEERLRALETLGKGVPLITLAGTAPNPLVRASLLRTLERHWEEGPNALKGLRSTEDVNVEPGFVALLKLLPRNDAVESAGGNDKATHNGKHHRSTTQPKKNLTDAQGKKKRQEQLGQQWMEFSRDVTQALCWRLCAAARDRQSRRGGVDRTADEARLPFKLQPHAEVAAIYYLDWPDEFQGKIADAPLLRVRYVRIEQKAAPATVLAFYRRQAPNGKEHPHAGGEWIDSIAIDKERSRARSVDVLVTKVGKTTLDLPNQEQELTVDVLTIECEGLAKPSPLSASR